MLPIKFKYYAIGATALLLVAATGIGVYKYIAIKSENTTLLTENTRLSFDNQDLKIDLGNEKRLREDTEKVLAHFKDLTKENKESEHTNTVIVEKIRQIDVKTIKAETINSLVSDLEGEWACINGCSYH